MTELGTMVFVLVVLVVALFYVKFWYLSIWVCEYVSMWLLSNDYVQHIIFFFCDNMVLENGNLLD